MPLILAVVVVALVGMASPQANPGIGEPIVRDEIRVTLLGAHRLTLDEYGTALRGSHAPTWAGGGFAFVFLTENPDGGVGGPALGEVKVFLGETLYNPVTFASSSKPFAPLVVIRDASEFAASADGRAFKIAPRSPKAASVLQVYIPGPAVPTGTGGVVELEQGPTHRRDSTGRVVPLSPSEIGKIWIPFRFKFPPLD